MPHVAPEICAKKILINLKRHEQENGNAILHAVLTRTDIRTCAGRAKLAYSYITNLVAAFYDLGWLLYDDYDGESFYLIDFRLFEGQNPFSLDKIDDLKDDRKIEEIYEEMFGE